MPIDLLADEGSQRAPIDLLADEPMDQQAPSQGFGRNLLDYEKALGIGLAQGAGDVGASIGNVPSDIWKYFTGNQPYHIPHPALQKYYPEGTAGKIGSSIGETIGNIAAPGGAAFKAIKAVNNPFLRALVGAGTGAVAGGASNEENRLTSALVGGLLGGGAPALGSVAKKVADVIPLTKSTAFAPYIEKAKYMQKHDLGTHMYVKPEHLNEARRLLESEGMGIPKEAIEHVFPMAHAGEHDALHAVQSTLKSVGRDFSRKGGVEGRLGDKMHKLAEKINDSMNEQFKIMGHGKAAQLEQQGKMRTARYYKQKPIRDMATKGVGAGLGLGGGYEFLKHLLSR